MATVGTRQPLEESAVTVFMDERTELREAESLPEIV